MSKFNSALWRDMMDYLRRRHTPICRQWFEELEPDTLSSGLLRVHTATSVQQNYLQKNCLEQFTEAAQAVTGALVAVRFVTNEDQDEVPLIAPAEVSDHQAVAVASRPLTHAAPVDFLTDQIVISPDYSFDNFITGPNNQLACAAAVAVANQPGTAYNPLFIHGGTGLGKTHLLQAICQHIMTKTPKVQILYVSCDAFINQFIEVLQSGQMLQFRHRYRHLDVLVLDDIQFLANRDRTQEEFFHTFNELYQMNRQIVLSSDAPPSDIPQLTERLISRFQWGLVATVTKPHYETRVAILRAKAKLRGVTAPDDVISYIATTIDTNARELEGAIITIQGYAALQGRPIDLALAQDALGAPASDPRTSQITLQHIIDVVTGYYNVRLADVQSRRRHKSITEPRQVCMYLARKRTRFSLEEIGGYFGGRDHTTVMHSIRTVENRMQIDQGFCRQVDRLDSELQSGTDV